MRMIGPDETLIAYGSARPPGDLLSVVDAGGGRSEVNCRMAHVVVRRGDALRLNSGGYEAGFDIDADAMDGPDMLRSHLARYCDMWRPGQRKFLDMYFDGIARAVQERRRDLLRRLALFGELYRLEDWIYSAYRPLPQAWLSAEPDSAAAYGGANLIGVDFALWTAAGAIAIVLAVPGSPDRRRAAQLAALSDTGVTVAQLVEGSFDGLPPGIFDGFWEGEALPAGPFRPGLPRELPS